MKCWLLDSCSSFKSKWIPLCRRMYVDFDGEFPSLIISSDISLCFVLNFKLDFAAKTDNTLEKGVIGSL